MKLEINKNDRAADVSKLKSRFSFQQKLAGVLATIMLFSGSALITPAKAASVEAPTTTQSVSIGNDDTILDLDDSSHYAVSQACHNNSESQVTIGDLKNMNPDYLIVHMTDDTNLDWLNYCESLESLDLLLETNSKDQLKNIKQLPSLKSVNISGYSQIESDMDKDTYAFLTANPTIEKLSLFNVFPEPGLIESLPNLRKLRLNIEQNFPIDFSKLESLQELDFGHSDNIYDIATYFSTEDMETLQAQGTKITFSDPEAFEKLKQVNKELDSIVESLGVTKQSSDQEKLDAILIYTLDKLTYDQGVSEALKNNTATPALAQSFYEDGNLYAALEKDSAICGNYAALVQALSHRLGLSSHYIVSENHAWNLVSVGGEEYYVDATWMDSDINYLMTQEETYDPVSGKKVTTLTTTERTAQDLIKEKDTSTLEWYMADPEAYPQSENQKESHIALNFPSFVALTPQEETEKAEPEKIEITPTQQEQPSEAIASETETETEKPTQITEEDKFEVTLNGKKWIIGGAAAVGILSGLGAAIAVSHKKREEERRRRRAAAYRQDIYPQSPTSTSYSTDWSTWDFSSGSTSTRTDTRGRMR